LAAHAPVDAQNNQGITPLMLAVADSHATAVKLLLAAGANPREQDYTGRDALGWTTDNHAIAELLKKAH
jgi:ankyrin repeat protein